MRATKFVKGIVRVAVLSCMAAVIATNYASAQITTDPVGFITVVAHGTNTSYWGLGMTQVPTNMGVIGSILNNEIGVSNQTFVAGGFNQTAEGPLYFLEVTSGSSTGLLADVVSNSIGSVFTLPAISNNVTVGTTFKVYPHWTLASLFGLHNSAGLLGASSAAAADTVNVPVQSSQGFAQYYYYTGTKHGGPNWEDSLNNDASNVRIWIDQGILVKRAALTNLTYTLAGGVKLGSTIVPIGGTNTFVGNVYASGVTTLSKSGLYTGVPTTGLVGGTSASAADNVFVHNDNNGQFAQYYYYTGTKHGGPNWEDSLNNDATNVQIPMGANVLIKLAGGHNGFFWTAPAPY